MSSLVDLLSASIKDSGLEQLSNKLGQDPRTTSEAVDSALPLLVGALSRSAGKDGARGLAVALDTKHDGSVLDDIAGFIDKDDNADGTRILGHVLGGSGDLAAKVLGAKTGLDQDGAKALMATLAPMLLGALGRARRRDELGTGDINQLLAAEEQSVARRAPGFSNVLGGILDADGDGDTDVNDLLNAGLKGLGRLF